MSEKCIIRQAAPEDLEELALLEKLCFPEKEAASKDDFSERLSAYANHFLVLEKDGLIVSMINGMVTDSCNLVDEMYHNSRLHNEQGKWQMVFGVATHPAHQGKGYASILIHKFIEAARLQNRRGVVLTCKARLIHYYEKFGFVNEGVSESEHGNVEWYQMRLEEK